jgi:hypothetical protein
VTTQVQRRKAQDEREARRLLSQAAEAGCDAGTWARRLGIDGRSLNAWQINLGRRGQAAPRSKRRRPVGLEAPLRLVEVVPSASATTSATSARYVVRIAGVEVELGDDFRADTLRRLLEVLHAC